MTMNQISFAARLDAALKSSPHFEGMTVGAYASTHDWGMGMRHYSAYVSVNPLPPSRVSQHRGGGAEAQNNLSRFSVSGWNELTGTAEKIKFEKFATIIPSKDEEMKKILRAKSFTDEDKAIDHIISCLHAVVQKYPARYTHAMKGEPEEANCNW